MGYVSGGADLAYKKKIKLNGGNTTVQKRSKHNLNLKPEVNPP